jgi:peptidoglycan/LPS O-acetylase OafA/YrhL
LALNARSPATPPATGNRTTFIDNLRVALTALVVFHHAAMANGSAGDWYQHEVPGGSNVGLTLFCLINQTFFMGFFFLIAGYFTPAAFDRKGPWRFMADRILRLGVPLLVFGFILNALTIALAQEHSIPRTLTVWAHLMARGLFGSGPLWFAQVLLTFSAVYVVRRIVMRRAVPAKRPLPSHAAMLTLALLVGISAFALRLVFPIGMQVSNLMFGYFPSYIVLFAVGVLGARSKWLERVPARLVMPWLIVSLLAALAFLAAVLTTGPFGYAGGWSARAASYAFFEPFFAWGVILGLLRLFNSYCNSPGPGASFLSARAYSVYVIHPPVLVLVTRSLSHWSAPVLIKFVATGTIGCAASLAVASLVLLVPGARRIL